MLKTNGSSVAQELENSNRLPRKRDRLHCSALRRGDEPKSYQGNGHLEENCYCRLVGLGNFNHAQDENQRVFP